MGHAPRSAQRARPRPPSLVADPALLGSLLGPTGDASNPPARAVEIGRSSAQTPGANPAHPRGGTWRITGPDIAAAVPDMGCCRIAARRRRLAPAVPLTVADHLLNASAW